MGNILPIMDPFQRPPSGRTARPPVLDMTPEGEFRDAPGAAGPGGPPAGPAASWLDRTLARVGGAALALALLAGGFVMAALAVLFLGLLLPVLATAGLIAFGTLWWRMRRLRRQAGSAGAGGGMSPPPPGGAVRFVVIRR